MVHVMFTMFQLAIFVVINMHTGTSISHWPLVEPMYLWCFLISEFVTTLKCLCWITQIVIWHSIANCVVGQSMYDAQGLLHIGVATYRGQVLSRIGDIMCNDQEPESLWEVVVKWLHIGSTSDGNAKIDVPRNEMSH